MTREVWYWENGRLVKLPSPEEVLQRQLSMEWLYGPWFKFQSVRDAVLFGIHLPNSFFPVQGEAIRIYFDETFLRGYNSLQRYREILKMRKYVALQDAEAVRRTRRFRSFEQEAAMCHPEGANPEDSIVTFISGGESFYEVMGAFALREMGYIVFPASAWTIPWEAGLIGVPDLIAFKLGNFHKYLIKAGVIKGGGFLAEIEMFAFLGLNEEGEIKEVPIEATVVEVEPEPKRASGGRKQLQNYMSSGLFDKAVLICPGRIEDGKWYQDSFITWNSEGNLIVHFSKRAFARRSNLTIEMAKRIIATLLLRAVKFSKLERFGELNFVKLIEKICESPELIEEIIK